MPPCSTPNVHCCVCYMYCLVCHCAQTKVQTITHYATLSGYESCLLCCACATLPRSSHTPVCVAGTRPEHRGQARKRTSQRRRNAPPFSAARLRPALGRTHCLPMHPLHCVHAVSPPCMPLVVASGSPRCGPSDGYTPVPGTVPTARLPGVARCHQATGMSSDTCHSIGSHDVARC